ncbi:hypothetical protein ACFQHW_10490 [Lapidilactobacillus achengensis]|uniref:Uncharacterized protein n=1 Tax=Lapidilactobacillus achengensis TaxID=2486000 RepID=A0ABW1USD0_9LACO|nr:hypothetical protein [Lapidilactobacillus achengensis]
MPTLKKIRQTLTKSLYSFFDLAENPAAADATVAKDTYRRIDSQQLTAQIDYLIHNPQIVSLQLKTNAANKRGNEFLIGQFKTIDRQQRTVIFVVKHSNLIQLINFDQIIRIAA